MHKNIADLGHNLYTIYRGLEQHAHKLYSPRTQLVHNLERPRKNMHKTT